MGLKVSSLMFTNHLDIMNFINIHFKSEQLGQFLKQKNAAMLHFVYNSETVSVLVNHSV